MDLEFDFRKLQSLPFPSMPKLVAILIITDEEREIRKEENTKENWVMVTTALTI